MTKREFTPKELLAYGLPYSALEDRIVGTGRWSIHHEIVFRTPEQEGTDRAWQTTYSEGATEYQDEGPWQYDDSVECVEVHQVEKVTKVWEAAP